MSVYKICSLSGKKDEQETNTGRRYYDTELLCSQISHGKKTRDLIV